MQVCVLKESSAACMLQSGKLVRVWCTFCAYERRKKQKKKLYLRLFFTSSAVLVMFLLLYTWPSHSPSLACWWLVLCCVRVFFGALSASSRCLLRELSRRALDRITQIFNSLTQYPSPCAPLQYYYACTSFPLFPPLLTHTHTYIHKKAVREMNAFPLRLLGRPAKVNAKTHKRVHAQKFFLVDRRFFFSSLLRSIEAELMSMRPNPCPV